jgi:hypothetical protein
MSQSVSWSDNDMDTLEIKLEDVCKEEFIVDHWVDLLDAAFKFIDETFQEFANIKISDDVGKVMTMLSG